MQGIARTTGKVMGSPIVRLFIAVLVLSGLVGLFVPLTGCSSARPTMFYNYYCFGCGTPEGNAGRAPSTTHYRAADSSGWGFSQGYTPSYTNGRSQQGQEGDFWQH